MRITPPLATLVLAACTAPRDGRPVDLRSLDLAAAARDHQADFVWVEAPAFHDLPGWQTRTKRLRVLVAEDGVHVVDRAAVHPDWKVSLRASTLGRAGRAEALPHGQLWAQGHSLDLLRGDVVEFAEHDPELGLEHGYRLLRRPDGSGPVELGIRVDGAVPVPTDDGALFLVPGRQVVGWRQLSVVDADGRELPAETRATDDGIAVVFDDDTARWPVTVDPLITELEATLSPFGGSAAAAGFAVDVAGDLTLIGNPGTTASASRSAALFERNVGGEDAWGQVALFDDPASVREGVAVALADDLAIVGSALGATDAKVAVYALDGNGWTDAATWDLNTAVLNGLSVDVGGDGAVIGLPTIDDGSIVVLNRYGGFTAVAAAPDGLGPTEDDELGASVSMWGDLVLAGIPGSDQAALFQVRKVGANFVQPVTVLSPTDPLLNGSRAGASVALSGRDAVVGAPGADRVVVFRREGPTWTAPGDVVEYTLAAPPGASPRFGSRVAAANGTIAVLDGGDPVRAFLFEWDGSAFQHVQTLDTGGTSLLPPSLALSETTLAVGLPDVNGAAIYRRRGDTWSVDTESTGVAGAQLGASLAVDRDLIVAGAPQSDAVITGGGEVYFFTRDSVGVFSLADTVAGVNADEHYGFAVDASQDLVLVGAPGYDGGQTDSGRAEVLGWDGASATLVRQLAPPAADVAAGLEFGKAVATDALKAVIGAPGRGGNVGGAYVFGRDHSTGWAQYPNASTVWLQGSGSGSKACFSAVAIEGPWLACSSGPAAGVDGEVRLQYGTVATNPVTVLSGTASAGDKFGSSMSLDGDLLAVGARLAGTYDEGQVQLFRLRANGTWQLERQLDGSSAGGEFGSAVAVQGDRLIVGASGANTVGLYRRNDGGPSIWGRVDGFAVINAKFGEAVALDGAIVAIGSPDKNPGGEVQLREWDAELPPLCYDLGPFDIGEDQLGSTTLTASDPDGDPITFSVVTGPSEAATFSLAADGTATYQASADWWGDDVFTFSVSDGTASCQAQASVHVIEINDPPVAVPDAFVVNEDESLVIAWDDLTANDTDPDEPAIPETLTPNKPSDPAHGTIQGQPVARTYTYEPAENWFGTEVLAYTVSDGRNGNSAPATLTIDVLPVNDLPTLGDPPAPVVLDEDTAYVSPPPGLFGAVVDVDGDPLTAVVLTPVQHGSLSIDPNGYWRYVPDHDWNGVDGFSYEVDDGTSAAGPVNVTLTVNPVNDPPVAVDDGTYVGFEDVPLQIDVARLVANDGDVDGEPLINFQLEAVATGGTVEVVAGVVTFRPTLDRVGSASFRYTVQDPDLAPSNPATVTLDFLEVNDAPVAEDDELAAVAGEAASVDVLANDTDVDGDPLSATLGGQPEFGAASISATGVVTYTASVDFVGIETLTYVLSDGRGGTATGTVEVTVSPAPDTEPEPHTGTVPTECDDPRTFYVDRDDDGFGDAATSIVACAAPGWVEDATDCDDRDANVFPGASELSGDGVDQNCDGRDNVLTSSGACGCDAAPSGVAALPLGLLAGLVARRRRSP